jgi:small GTP-binding protein
MNPTLSPLTISSPPPEVIFYEAPLPTPPPSSLPQHMREGRPFEYYKEGHSLVASHAFKKLEKSKAANKKGVENKEQKAEYILLMVGDDKSGKTSLIQAFLHDKFTEEHSQTTFELYKTQIKNGVVEIWDTGNTPEYTTKLPLCYAVASCIILCFSLNDPEGFRNIKLKWTLAIREKTLAPILLVGTKKDLATEATLKMQEPSKIQEYADKVGGRYVACSAKTRENVVQVFNVAVDLSAEWTKKMKKK